MVEVRFSAERLARFGNPILAGLHILEKLREADVPATGLLYVVAAETGILEIEFEPDLAGSDDTLIYRWKP